MAKKDDGYEGIPIKFKRTTGSISQKSGEQVDFGEPVYFDSDGYLVVGPNGGLPDTSQATKVFKSVNRADAQNMLFINSVSGGDIISLKKDGGTTEYYSKIKKITSRNSNGIPVVSTTEQQSFIPKPNGSNWYAIDQNGKPNLSQTTSSAPMVYRLPVINMTSEIMPIVSLAVPFADRKSSSTVNSYKNAFSTLSDVESDTGYINFYCLVKAPATSFYVDIYGG